MGANAAEHQLIIGVGAGTRARHAYDLGSRLGLPTGLLATLGSGVSEQNAMMIAALMARYNAVRLGKSEFSQLPMCLAAGSPVVVTGSPPYRWWEPPPSVGRLPEYRTDSGVWLIAEAFGARSMIYLKDENGLYTDDPKKNPEATFIPRIGVAELIARDFDELVIERKVLEMMLWPARPGRFRSSTRWSRETSPGRSRASTSARSSPPMSRAPARSPARAISRRG